MSILRRCKGLPARRPNAVLVAFVLASLTGAAVTSARAAEAENDARGTKAAGAVRPGRAATTTQPDAVPPQKALDAADVDIDERAVAIVDHTTSSTSAIDRWTALVRAETAPGLELPYLALRLPQYLIELAFVPLMPIVTLFERYRLLDRFLDLVTNDKGTAAVLPLVDPFNNAGLGAGAVVLYNEPFGSQDRFIALGQIYPNRDRIFSVSFARRFPTFSGRRVSLSASYNVDHDTRYFGLGADRSNAMLRLLRTDAVNAEFGITLINPTRLPEYFVEIAVAYRRRKLGTGNGTRGPGLTPEGDLPVPAGFRRALDYPEITLSTEYDSRDSFGVTSKGLFARLRLTATRDLNGAATSGIRAEGVFAAFIPVLPRFRTLFIKVGASGTAPLPITGDEQVPLHTMVNLGGSTNLRGYVNDRFIDRMGWFATVEYRYRFFDYADKGMGISGALFGDVGRVGPTLSDLIRSPMPWSVGIGLRLEQNLVLAGRIQFAYSPEGFQFSVGFGEIL